MMMKSMFLNFFVLNDFEFFSEYVGYAPIRHIIVDISMSEISNERQGQIFEIRILETLKLLPAFLAGYLVSH